MPVILVFLSGVAALVYQILWVLIVGLAIGGGLVGRRADRSARPLRLFAALEAGTGVLGLTATLVLAHAAPGV